MDKADYITTSDISEFMRNLGFQWSNDAQVYYCDQFVSRVNSWHTMDRATAEHLYIKLREGK